MPTNDERREVAAKLRELAQESARCGDDGVGERACRVLLGPRVDLLDVVDAHFPLAHLADLIEPEPIDGDASDGYHTFNELYDHRAKLFSVVVAAFSNIAWKSKRHSDGSMYEGMFIVGIDTPHGQATYHYEIEPYWELFRCSELPKAPEFDGHTPTQAIDRIASLADLIEPEERTCHIEPLSLHEFFAGEKYILSRGARESAEDERFDRLAREIEKDACFMCSNCHVLFGTREAANADYDILEDGTYEVGNVAPLIKFCPNCGAKVIQE